SIRRLETTNAKCAAGIEYYIIGTKSSQDIEWLVKIFHQFPYKLYLSVDAYQREIKINCWEQDAHLDLFDFVQQIESLPLGGIIYTDISKDGRLSGPNFEITTQLVEATQKPVIASGGIRHQQDLELLEKSGVYAAIVGKAAHNPEFWEGLS